MAGEVERRDDATGRLTPGEPPELKVLVPVEPPVLTPAAALALLRLLRRNEQRAAESDLIARDTRTDVCDSRREAA